MIPETGMRTRGAQNLFCRFLHHEQSVREPLPLVGPPLRDGEAGGSTTFRGFCMSAPRDSTSSGARRAAERGEHPERLVLVEVGDRRAPPLPSSTSDSGRPNAATISSLCAPRIDSSVRVTSYSGRFVIALKSAEPSAS